MSRYILLIFIFCSCSQTAKKPTITGMDTYQDFRQMVVDNKKLLCDSSNVLSVYDAIKPIKMANTIHIYLLNTRDSLFADYDEKFVKCSAQRIVKLLDMQLTAGMMYYSPKYDLFFGAFDSATNSYYQLDSLSLSHAPPIPADATTK